ncbi:hypothetical protein N8J89_01770 [Crossiella sp. CA-258035]|uniref:hypothetical protein n=1 Tax=Crossiella sp. CA-258035 TaxID=2981138 RepID=UPI0024BCAD83|nr:hypothetical protein [Crossiella sp. CA-258035]WHT19833.1 hypothetical protein N8J89_01770 [Crossiella sp. CA-258035]
MTHHRPGEAVLLAESALRSARSLAERGKDAEAEAVCREGLTELPGSLSEETDRLRVELLELLLLLTEPRWSRSPEYRAANPVERWAADAEAAAARIGDLQLRIRAASVAGRVLHRTQGVEAALAVQRRAVELASQSGDAVVQFLTLSAYGRELTKRDLRAGLAVLLEAEKRAKASPEITGSRSTVLRGAFRRTELEIGVGEFDAGYLGIAKTRLEFVAARLRAEPESASLLPIALNHLAKAQLAIGLWDPAADTLTEAVGLGDGAPDPWHAYNLALFGRLRVELGDLAAGVHVLESAWAETNRTPSMTVATLVCNLYAEGLLLTAGRRADVLGAVEELLAANLERCQRVSMVRSEVLAHSLLARLHLAMDELPQAHAASAAAVELYARRGPLPTVRGEEVLYWHAETQRRSGRADAAVETLSRARQLVRAKANSLDPELREFFLAVPLNQRIAEPMAGVAEGMGSI